MAENRAMQMISENAPLGVLSLAAVLEKGGRQPLIVDLNRWYYDFLRREPDGEEHADEAPMEFAAFAAERLEALPVDVYGFSTICSSYPLTLRIAESVKRARPDSVMVLGGPQASVVDVPSMRAFPFVDYVVRGEAEETLPLLLDALDADAPTTAIAGLTFRVGAQVERNPNAPVVKDLDALPTPAFHRYPYIDQCRDVSIELGRGCPFACEFCSTNDFFRRRFRLKSPGRVLDEMRQVRREYGITAFDLVHDMFTVDRRKVVEFCETLLEAGESFQWSCSARTDCVDDELIALMHRAGCRGIFFGIETGSARLQKIVKKRIDLHEAMARLECADRHGIKTAASLITGFPEETMEDLRGTTAFLMDALRLDHVEPQLHLLAPLADTPIQRRYADQLTLDGIYSDMSHQGWQQNAEDREMIAAHPEVFPNFYTVPTPWLEKSYLKELREFMLVGIRRFRWLLIALHQDSGDLLTVFDAWRGWRRLRGGRDWSSSFDVSAYYAHPDFPDELFEFLETDYLTPATNPAHSGILEMVGLERAVRLRKPADGAPGGGSPGAGVPHIPASVSLHQLAVDYEQLIGCLRRREGIARLPGGTSILARITKDDGEAAYVSLSQLSARLLELCDGVRSVDEITETFARSGPDTGGVDPRKAGLFGLEVLRRQGLVGV
ncbi:B12-binding domain-containing radical SAM protein [Kitasatospora sp. NPDC127059]|uniref:B12-binding domain-containing radical SAM protein n=1 Tax=unclassified Kitasatospora TaxID=2633591 RepID=UPI00364FA59D